MPPTGHPCILSIDLGTSAVKLALITTRGAILAADEEPLPLSLLPAGGAEQDPEHWWEAIVRATQRLLARGAATPGDVIGVNVGSQWSGTVAVNEQGRPLHPALLWMDSRGASYIQKMAKGLVSIDGYGLNKLLPWVRLTGGAPSMSGKDPLGHILYLQHEHPEVYRSTYKFLEPKDWLNLRLTGRFAASYDSITLHWVTDNRNLSQVRYDERLLKMTGLHREKLPDLVPAASVLGPLSESAAQQLGLSQEAQVVSGMPDILAAAVGSGAVRDFEAHLCVGTSSWLSCHVPYKKTDLLHQMGSLPSALPGRYLLVNEQESAGICLVALKNLLFETKDAATAPSSQEIYAGFERAAESVSPGSDRLLFLPWLNGERSPVDDRLARGGFLNLSLRTTRGHMVRAVLEGVAYNSRWLLTYVEQFVGRKLESIRMIGGGARSKLWCQIYADVLGRTIQQVESPVMANARGAAFQAAVALGHLTVEEIPSLVPVARTYEPDPRNRERYDELFREFLSLYKTTKPLFARLNRARDA